MFGFTAATCDVMFTNGSWREDNFAHRGGGCPQSSHCGPSRLGSRPVAIGSRFRIVTPVSATSLVTSISSAGTMRNDRLRFHHGTCSR